MRKWLKDIRDRDIKGKEEFENKCFMEVNANCFNCGKKESGTIFKEEYGLHTELPFFCSECAKKEGLI